VNPTASISGLLDKLTAGYGQGRAAGRALAAWEQMLRTEGASIALTLAEPVIASGLRETLVYAVERRYVDVIVASADDLFSDLYESLGHAHYAGDSGVVANEAGRAEALAFLRAFLTDFAGDSGREASSAMLWKALGEALTTCAPRAGLLRAAARAGVAIITPDISASVIGGALLAARAAGATLALDAGADLLALAKLLGAQPNLGLIRVGAGLADGLLYQACAALGGQAPAIMGRVTIGVAGDGTGQGLTLAVDATLALPLLVTGLAQRFPGARQVSATPADPREVAPVLA
jgi:deoxyhypusine synthase